MPTVSHLARDLASRVGQLVRERHQLGRDGRGRGGGGGGGSASAGPSSSQPWSKRLDAKHTAAQQLRHSGEEERVPTLTFDCVVRPV